MNWTQFSRPVIFAFSFVGGITVANIAGGVLGFILGAIIVFTVTTTALYLLEVIERRQREARLWRFIEANIAQKRRAGR